MKDELLNKLNKYHFPPLMIACFRGYHTKGKKDEAQVYRIKIVDCLLENGARADYITKDTKMTAMHWAAYNKDSKVVQALLENRAPELTRSHVGRLPIDVAGSSMAYNVVDTCLQFYFNKVAGGEITKKEDHIIRTND